MSERDCYSNAVVVFGRERLCFIFCIKYMNEAEEYDVLRRGISSCEHGRVACV